MRSLQFSIFVVVEVYELATIDVGNLKKLHGKDVVIAHKLLKNSVPAREYLLITDVILKDSKINKDHIDWAKVISGADVYNKTMSINYGYILLNFLLAKVPLVEHVDLPQKTENPFRHSLEIEAPVNLVQSYLTDLSMKNGGSKILKVWNTITVR